MPWIALAAVLADDKFRLNKKPPPAATPVRRNVRREGVKLSRESSMSLVASVGRSTIMIYLEGSLESAKTCWIDFARAMGIRHPFPPRREADRQIVHLCPVPEFGHARVTKPT